MVLVRMLPIVVKLLAGVVVAGGCTYHDCTWISSYSCLILTLLVTMCVVVVVVVLDSPGFQISKVQKRG